MSAFFQKPNDASVVLLVDIENSSVATALAQLSSSEGPKLYAEHRIHFPIDHSVTSEKIAERINRAVIDTLGRTSEIAVRLRRHSDMSDLGQLSGAHIFFSAPWVSAEHDVRLRWIYEPQLLIPIRKSTESVLGEHTILHHPFGRALSHAIDTTLRDHALVCLITGEVLELFLVAEGKTQAYATVPVGYNTIVRTVSMHTGCSVQEAQSAIKLYQNTPNATHMAHEPLQASAEHLVHQFVDAASDLLQESSISQIVIIGKEPVDEWFAKEITANAATSALFPQGGTTRALRPKHVSQYLAAHAQVPDMPLMLEAMFINTHQKMT